MELPDEIIKLILGKHANNPVAIAFLKASTKGDEITVLSAEIIKIAIKYNIPPKDVHSFWDEKCKRDMNFMHYLFTKTHTIQLFNLIAFPMSVVELAVDYEFEKYKLFKRAVEIEYDDTIQL